MTLLALGMVLTPGRGVKLAIDAPAPAG